MLTSSESSLLGVPSSPAADTWDTLLFRGMSWSNQQQLILVVLNRLYTDLIFKGDRIYKDVKTFLLHAKGSITNRKEPGD